MTQHEPDRAPRSRRIGIIGAGPGGICAGMQLLDAGIDTFTILERAPSVGGTWFHNTYPGAACDVPSVLYSFSFAPKRDWTRPYANQPEIRAYFEECVERSGLTSHIRLDTEVRGAHWDDDRSVWRVVTDAEELEFDVLIGAVGMFGNLTQPELPGLEDFAGTVFHSARWDHDHALDGERVAVIGSAASAVQFVPEIAPRVEQLLVFQRTPNWVMPKMDDPFTPEQLDRLRNDPDAIFVERKAVFDRMDDAITFADQRIVAASQEMARQNMQVVEDPDVRARLTPDFPHGCKRPLISNEWYPTFNRPNVELVTDRIERITADSIVTEDGMSRAVDTIVLATGFETTRYLSTIEVTGRDGQRLDDAWSEGAQAYLGITTAGFPNLFMLYGPNTNNGSILYMIECQVGYVLRQLERLDAEELVWIDVRPEAMDDYNTALQGDLDAVEVWAISCNNYYRGPSGRIVTQWPHSMSEYGRRTSRDDRGAYASRPR